MPEKNKIRLPDGSSADGVSVHVNQSSEQWSQYFLEDGSVLKVKLVVTKVSRLENAYDAEGNPVYIFQSANVTSVEAPDNLKKRG